MDFELPDGAKLTLPDGATGADAAVREGDEITIDAAARRLDMALEAEEIDRRVGRLHRARRAQRRRHALSSSAGSRREAAARPPAGAGGRVPGSYG